MVSNTAALELCFMLSRIHSSPDKAIASPSLAPPPSPLALFGAAHGSRKLVLPRLELEP